jgi:beta-N-acetylhexosaminidase
MLKTFKQILFILTMALTLEKELFEDYYPKASKILSKMSIREKVGQLFFPRYNKLTVEKELIEKNPGGYILFANNLENHTLEEIINELKLVQEKSKIKLGLGVDEEGGKVNRVSLYFREKPFPSPQNLYNEGGIEKILLIEKEKRDLLRKLGFNFNLAPVADISTNKSDYIYERSLGRNENETSDYIRREIEESNKDNKFTQCLKHFPGYGNNSDTHFNLVVDDRKYEIFEKKDF